VGRIITAAHLQSNLLSAAMPPAVREGFEGVKDSAGDLSCGYAASSAGRLRLLGNSRRFSRGGAAALIDLRIT
jgi:hypothetical protein